MDRWSYSQPTLKKDENPLSIETSTRLYDGEERTAFEDGTLTLTPLRLIWVDSGPSNRCVELSLSTVRSVSKAEGHNNVFHKASPKIFLELHSITDRSIRRTEEWVRISPKADSSRISFRGGAHQINEFVTQLEKAVAAKKWEVKVSVGITGIINRKQQQLSQSDATIKDAFKGDLEALMKNAKEMVTLAEAYAKKVNQDKVAKDESSEFQSYILSLGIPDPVTKSSANSGSKFHLELAKELGMFLKNPLEQAKGMMMLQDVYCLYNRARGTELISPDDLVNAANLFAEANIPIVLRSFDSGVRVVQARGYSDEEVAKKVLKLATATASVTVSQFAQAENISTTLARECLLCTERYGMVCRDDTIESLRFFPNRFLGHGIEI